MKKSGMSMEEAFREALAENDIEFKPLEKGKKKDEITLVDKHGKTFTLDKDLKIKPSKLYARAGVDRRKYDFLGDTIVACSALGMEDIKKIGLRLGNVDIAKLKVDFGDIKTSALNLGDVISANSMKNSINVDKLSSAGVKSAHKSKRQKRMECD